MTCNGVNGASSPLAVADKTTYTEMISFGPAEQQQGQHAQMQMNMKRGGTKESDAKAQETLEEPASLKEPDDTLDVSRRAYRYVKKIVKFVDLLGNHPKAKDLSRLLVDILDSDAASNSLRKHLIALSSKANIDGSTRSDDDDVVGDDEEKKRKKVQEKRRGEKNAVPDTDVDGDKREEQEGEKTYTVKLKEGDETVGSHRSRARGEGETLSSQRGNSRNRTNRSRSRSRTSGRRNRSPSVSGESTRSISSARSPSRSAALSHSASAVTISTLTSLGRATRRGSKLSDSSHRRSSQSSSSISYLERFDGNSTTSSGSIARVSGVRGNASWAISATSGVSGARYSSSRKHLKNKSCAKQNQNIFGNLLVPETIGGVGHIATSGMVPTLPVPNLSSSVASDDSDSSYLQFDPHSSHGSNVGVRTQTAGLSDLLDDLRQSRHNDDDVDHEDEEALHQSQSSATMMRKLLKKQLSKKGRLALSLLTKRSDHSSSDASIGGRRLSSSDRPGIRAADVDMNNMNESITSLGSFASMGSLTFPKNIY